MSEVHIAFLDGPRRAPLRAPRARAARLRLRPATAHGRSLTSSLTSHLHALKPLPMGVRRGAFRALLDHLLSPTELIRCGTTKITDYYGLKQITMILMLINQIRVGPRRSPGSK